MIGIVKVCILHVLSIIFSYSKYIVSTCNGGFVILFGDTLPHEWSESSSISSMGEDRYESEAPADH